MSSTVLVRVLIVEEFALFREMLGDFVRSQNDFSLVGQCSTIADGAEACLGQRPDIVILGWVLPDGTGDQLLRAVAPALPDTRWLVVGVEDGGAAVQTAISLGAQGVLMKESGLSTLAQALRQIAAKSTFYCPLSSRVLLDFLRHRHLPGPDGLTERELGVLRHFALGLAPKGIADELRITVKTVQNQLSSIRQKTGVQETAGLVRYAIRIGVA